MNHPICHIQYRTHAVHISQEDSGLIHCFKYTQTRCELESFWLIDDVSEYTIQPLSSLVYEVKVE
jgi:hypothetical protein